MSSLFIRFLMPIAVISICIFVISSFPNTKAIKQIIRIAGTLALIIVLITVIKDINFDFLNIFNFKEANKNVNETITDAQEQNNNFTNQVIEEKIKGYLEGRAESVGVDCVITVKTVADESNNLSIDSVEISYSNKPDQIAIDKLSQIITDECGVPKDKQKYKNKSMT